MEVNKLVNITKAKMHTYNVWGIYIKVVLVRKSYFRFSKSFSLLSYTLKEIVFLPRLKIKKVCPPLPYSYMLINIKRAIKPQSN